jgi:hypothetical protein
LKIPNAKGSSGSAPPQQARGLLVRIPVPQKQFLYTKYYEGKIFRCYIFLNIPFILMKLKSSVTFRRVAAWKGISDTEARQGKRAVFHKSTESEGTLCTSSGYVEETQ